MIQAVFCDFYGTLVHEDGKVINTICREIMGTGRAENTQQIASYWWNIFQENCHQSYECFILGKHTARNGVAGISPPRRDFQKC